MKCLWLITTYEQLFLSPVSGKAVCSANSTITVTSLPFSDWQCPGSQPQWLRVGVRDGGGDLLWSLEQAGEDEQEVGG